MNIIDTKINHGFWKERKELNKNTSLYAVLKSFETSGRIRALTGENTKKERGIKISFLPKPSNSAIGNIRNNGE